MAVLRGVRGPACGHQFKLAGDRIYVGRRPDCEVVLSHKGVSRQHAVIRRCGSQYSVHDLDSRNGTFVNDEPCSSFNLGVGDVIRICGYEFVFELAPERCQDTHEHESTAKLLS